jgi:phosphatidylglycerophosphate synthase
MDIKQSKRIQTSVLNGMEKRALVWLAERQPKWVSSNLMTFVGFVGAAVVAAGFVLSNLDIQWLWLSSLGLVINWYGDSLDGTLARARNSQRPIFGYYVDHTIDCVN